MNRIAKYLFTLLISISVFLIGVNYVNAESSAGEILLSKTASKKDLEKGRSADVTLTVNANGFSTVDKTDVVLVLDRSSSMNGTPMENTKTAAKDLIELLITDKTKAKTRAAIVTYGSDLLTSYTSNSLTNDVTTLKDTINSIPSSINNEGTNVHAGLLKAEELLRSSGTDTQKIVILLSDGEPTYYIGTDNKIHGMGGSDNYENDYCEGYYSHRRFNYYNSGKCYVSEDDNTVAMEYSNYGNVFTTKDAYKPSTNTNNKATTMKADGTKIYTIGFGKGASGNAYEFLGNIASNPTDKYRYTASDYAGLKEAFNKIVNDFTKVATDAIVTDIVPVGFQIKEGTLPSVATAIENKDGTTTITWKIGDIKSTAANSLTYTVEAKKGEYGSMYTNVSATIKAKSVDGNPKYGSSNPISLDFDKPYVPIPGVTVKDDYYDIKQGTTFTTPAEKGILDNDELTHKNLDENATVTDRIVLVYDNETNGKAENITLNQDGTFSYNATKDTLGKITYKYYVETTVEVNGKSQVVISNVSTITLNVIKNPTKYVVNYLEKGTDKVLHDAKSEDGNVYDEIKLADVIMTIKGYNYDSVNVDPLVLSDNTVLNVMNIYYTKRTDLSYTVNYYYNGKLGFREYFDNMEYLYEISGVDPKPEYNGVTYTKYDLKTSSENGLLPLIIGTGSNYINVYYGTPNVTISKKVNETAVKVGDTLHYTIKVTETRGLVDASGINVTDPIPEGLENVRNITHNGNLNEGNVEWNNLTITKNSSITLEFDATVSATTIGKTISNTANLGGTTSGDSNTVTTTVSELKAAVKEIKKGTTGKDAVNVVLVMDLSYSMQEKKTTDNVTRLEAAKKAATKFINSIYTKDPNSKVTVTVLTFNTKNPVTGIVGKTECTAWHNHDRHGCKKINGVWYSDWEETTETLPYSGTLKLGFADKTNYSSLVSKIEEITLPDSNPSYNYGWNTTGLGTNVYEALQLTESTVKELETNHSENSNVVILLSDGAPTTSYSGNSSWNEYEELRNKASEIKGNPITTEFYSIQFGTEDGAYGLLQAMSSNNSVYTSNSIDTLVENFTNILEQNITKDPIDTVNGKYTTTLSNPLVVDADNPITVTYEGTTLFTCTSLLSNGLTYDSTTKTISWDINAWNAVEGHPKVTTNNIVIQCYVER